MRSLSVVCFLVCTSHVCLVSALYLNEGDTVSWRFVAARVLPARWPIGERCLGPPRRRVCRCSFTCT